MQKDSPLNKEPVYDEVDYLKTTPSIPTHIVNYLPELLIEGCEAFKDNERKRDVFLTAGLTILSGCLPNVTGIYHQERVYPHLFSFIIAPAASGKGVLKNAKRLGDKIHDRFVNKSNEAKKAFEIENAEYKTMLANKRLQIYSSWRDGKVKGNRKFFGQEIIINLVGKTLYIMKTLLISTIVIFSSLQLAFGQEDSKGKFSGIQGEWEVWISGAVTQRAIDDMVVQSYQPGASMNNLKIDSDGSYTWGSVKSKLKLSKPWYAEANRDYFTVTDKSGNQYEFYHKKDTDKLILLFGGVGGHAATGHRISTGQDYEQNREKSQDQIPEKEPVTTEAETVGTPSTKWSVGDQIEILWSVSWYPGRILEIGRNSVKVHYTGWGNTYDEWVTLDRIRVTKNESADQRKQTNSETEKEPATGKLQVGQQVQINWSGIWYKGFILEVNNGKYKVRYDGWGSAYDEWVGPDRLKKL